MASLGKITRRTFLGLAAVAAGGLAVGYYFYQKDPGNPLAEAPPEGQSVFNPYVMIAADGTVTIIAPRAEMGQGISTTLAALVAEELDVSLSAVKVEHGPASAAYRNLAMLTNGVPYPEFDESFTANSMRSLMGIIGTFLSVQVTGGSSSTVDGFEKMRYAGAAARESLKQAAAAKWNVPLAEITTENGRILHAASNKSFSYSDVAADAAKMAPPSNITLRDPSQWRILGKPQQRVDMLAKVTGAPIFGIDVRLPDMLYATVRMNPNLGAPMAAMDDAGARQIPGVTDVIPLTSQIGNGFAVIATNTWAAFRGAAAVKPQWAEAAYPKDSAAISALLAKAFEKPDGDVLRNVGDATTAMAGEGTLVEARYEVPFLAHATMEPMNATAQFKDGKLEIWSPNQGPTFVKSICAGVAGIKAENVAVHTTMMGGAFGRRGEVDFSIYATLVAMKTNGRPVQVVWTREEDMGHGPFRPASMALFRAKLGADGLPVAMDARIAAQSIIQSVLKRTYPSLPAGGPDQSIAEGSFNQPYGIPNLKVTAIKADMPIPVTFWRSVGNSNNGFFHESFVDEMAAAGKLDPVEFRLKLMAPHPRAAATVAKVAEMSGWRDAPAAGRAKGLAFTLSFGTWVAMVVEVANTPGGIRITNVWAVADIGRALDVEIVKAQIMGAAFYGLSSAMGEEITFADGKVQQSNYFDYPPMRLWQAPAFNIEVLESGEHMGGAGEPGTPPAAPALANAIAKLTGKRIRTLPLSREVTFA